MNIKQVLKKSEKFLKKHDISNPRLDAEVLLAALLDMERINLYVNFDYPLTNDELTQYRSRIKERANRKPTAYITGKKEFMSLEFDINEQVLIPRPETELLVEEIISICQKQELDKPNIVDIGTGSGAIMVSLGYHIKEAKILGIDVSQEILKTARQNINKYDLDERLKVIKGNLLKPLIKRGKNNVDIVVSNPPYIKEKEMENLPPEVKQEPEKALNGGEQGIKIIQKIISQAFEVLKQGGFLGLEIGYDQKNAVKNIFKKDKWDKIRVKQDHSQNDRIVIAQKKQ